MLAATQDGFEVTLARPAVHGAGEEAALVHLWWRRSNDGQLVQVYVDDELADVTVEPGQREMWLLLDRSRAHRIELLAVHPEEVWVARPELLRQWSPRVRDVAKVAVLRDEALAVDARVRVAVDGQVVDEAPMWPSDVHRSGFGGLFGEGGFGVDAATGPGLGAGELGMGALGADGSAWRWRGVGLAEGAHTVSVSAVNANGAAAAVVAEREVVIQPLARPTAGVTVDEDFTLRW